MVKRITSAKALTKFVMYSIFIVSVYTLFEFISGIAFNISHDVLTECVYKFFGAEIAACGFIKLFKIREGGN